MADWHGESPGIDYYITSDIVALLDDACKSSSLLGSCIPRGFSRYFVLEVLKEGSRTGNEIIKEAEEKSQGLWKPSPGLIYPLLGRLLAEGLVEETDGRYSVTEKGLRVSEDLDKVRDAIQHQIDVITRIFTTGHFIAMDAAERLAKMIQNRRQEGNPLTEQEKTRYRRFLKSELEKLDSEGKDIPIQ